MCKLRLKANWTPVLNRQECFRREEDKENVTLLERNSFFDAFVLYRFDTDDGFVINL